MESALPPADFVVLKWASIQQLHSSHTLPFSLPLREAGTYMSGIPDTAYFRVGLACSVACIPLPVFAAASSGGFCCEGLPAWLDSLKALLTSCFRMLAGVSSDGSLCGCAWCTVEDTPASREANWLVAL